MPLSHFGPASPSPSPYPQVHSLVGLCLYSRPCRAACGILVPRPGIEPVPPAVEAWSLNHWTAREVPEFLMFQSLISETSFSISSSLEGAQLYTPLTGVSLPPPLQLFPFTTFASQLKCHLLNEASHLQSI